MNAPARSVAEKFCAADEAVAMIADGQAVACVGVIGWITPDLLLERLGRRFEETGRPRGLTFYFPCGTGDAMGIRGMDHVAREGLMKRIVAGSFVNPVDPRTGRRPELMRLIREDRIEAYSWPIGASMHWLREVARRSPGYLTRVGLGCYIDPEHGGGKFTTRCRDELVEKIMFRAEPYLFYPTWPLDVGFIRATSADDEGNLSFEHEPLQSSSLALAMAVKACGGVVIAQVERRVPRRSRPAHTVRIPGVLVDRVVVCPEQMMVTDTRFDPRFLEPAVTPLTELARLPPGPHKVIARRAAREVRARELSIFGFGASSDTPLVMVEDGRLDAANLDEHWFTTEHGSFGGVLMSDWQFSANLHPSALVDGVSQFDLIDGGLCRFAALAFAQCDAGGRVNVSKFGSANPGAGGFIDIAHNARRLVFTGTFTTGGAEIAVTGRGLCITREGRVRKLVRTVEHVTYDACCGVRERGQEALVLTERAVFRIEPAGLALVEIAPGVDVRRDVLEQMEFAPNRIAEPLAEMATELFAESSVGPDLAR